MYKKRIYFITIITIICILICLFSLICLILSSISIKKNIQIRVNILQNFNNEITDYYNKIRWQEIIEILNLILYTIGFFIFLYLSYRYLKQSNYQIFTICKFNIPSLSSIIKLRRDKIKYLILNFSILSILSFIISLVLLIIKDFNDGYSKDIKYNWGLSPIYSINDSSYSEYVLGHFNGMSDSTYGSTNYKKLYKFNKYSFKVKRKDPKYNYLYFFTNKKQNTQKCGVDDEGNGIYFPSDEICPINFIEITKNNSCSANFKYITKKINDYYIHYSNENINGKILIDFKISERENSPCGNANYDNDICSEIKEKCNNIEHKKCNDKYNDYGYELLDNSTFFDLFNDNSIKISDAAYRYDTPIYLYYRTYKGIVRKEVENISKTYKYLKTFFDVSDFSKGKNIYFLIIHIVIIILLVFIFYYFDENEEINSKKLYLISLLEILINIINIILCSITIDFNSNFKNHIFKYLNSDIYDKYKNAQAFIVMNILILIFNILLLISVCFWTYYYYINRDLYVKKEWKIIIYLKQPKYTLFSIIMLFSLIILILEFILVIKKEYNNDYFKGLEQNWKKSPIYSISISQSSNKNSYQFSKFPGTKNKGYGNEKSKQILYWNSYSFELKRNNLNYKKLLKGNIKCGVDSYGNELYFQSREDCPINYIEITSNSSPSSLDGLSIKDFKTLRLDDKYIHYTNKYYSGKILVDFKISDNITSFSINLDNNICKFIDGMCNLNKNDFINEIIENDKYIFDKIDSINISHLFNNNDININQNSFNSSQMIYLYKQTYIGLPDTKISIKNVLTIYFFLNVKILF